MSAASSMCAVMLWTMASAALISFVSVCTVAFRLERRIQVTCCTRSKEVAKRNRPDGTWAGDAQQPVP
eukprot:8582992-Alexandrium_andersonii.AAC.1